MPLSIKNFDFVPSSTRRALSYFGYECWVETPLGARHLPACQIEGEIDWHIDMLRWHAKGIAYCALLLPENHVEDFYKEASAELCCSGEFTSVEVFTVLEHAKDIVLNFNGETFSRAHWSNLQDDLAKELRQLGERLAGFAAKERVD